MPVTGKTWESLLNNKTREDNGEKQMQALLMRNCEGHNHEWTTPGLKKTVFLRKKVF